MSTIIQHNMDAVLKRLHFKNEDRILVRNVPDVFARMVNDWQQFTLVDMLCIPKQKYSFMLFFVKSEKQINETHTVIQNQLNPNGILWFAFPQKSNLETPNNFEPNNRWQSITSIGFEAVKHLALNNEWEALQFRFKTLK